MKRTEYPNGGGQVASELPCVHTHETGKHEYSSLHWNHRKGYLLSVPLCPSCGWIDTERMIREISLWAKLKLFYKLAFKKRFY